MTARRLADLLPPLAFGFAVLALWEAGVRLLHVPAIILPPPSAIATRFMTSIPTLSADFWQTIKGVLAGYVIGSASGLLVAIVIDRSQFLQRGLLPLGNLVSALPIVGIAPIMVMWFGFDWQSKAAVVVVMTFFPMLVNTVAGLESAGAMERDLMKTYAADYWQTLLSLRLPAALPFVFNALKINTTLAMIGAIVAEFFGTPTVGMGFRISTEVGHLGIDMVWATIVVAALTGSLFYALVAGVGAPRDVLARLLSEEGRLRLLAALNHRGAGGMNVVQPEDRKNEDISVCFRQRGGDCGRGRRSGGRQGHAAAEMGAAGAIRRLLRRQGQGLLQG